MRSIKILFTATWLISSVCHAHSCLPDVEPPAQKPVVYEVLDHQLWRHETQTDKRTLVKDITDVQSVAQSVLNCVTASQRSHEANMVVVSKTDGTVWIRGVIWNYNINECDASDTCHRKGQYRMLDTKGKWKQINGFKQVIKVVAGETWVAALTQTRQVFRWGTHNGNAFWFALYPEQVNHTPPLDYTVTPMFEFPAYRDLMAFHNAAYGLMMDGQVTAFGNDSIICRVSAHAKYIAGNHVCPFIYPQQGKVERIWQTPGRPEECNAQFVDGQLWQWPCDLRDENLLITRPIVPDQIIKTRVAKPDKAL